MNSTIARTLTIVGLGLIAMACKGKDGSASEPVAAAVTVDVATLVADYKANEVRGDAKYKGKRVQVTGIVGDIKKNAFDQIYVELGQGKQFDMETAQCHFPKESTEKAAMLDKGTTITVDCKCEGKIITFVNLADCKFVGAPPAGGAVAAKESTPGAKTASAEEVCKKLETAGVAKTCTKTENGFRFDVPGLPPTKNLGNITAIADEKAFGKYLASVEAMPPTSPLRPFYASQKANAVVHLPKGMPAPLEAKAKATVEAL